MADNTQKLDNELADLADALMAGQDMTTSNELQELAKISRQLHALIASDSSANTANDAYRNRLTQRLNDEWAQIHNQPLQRSSQRRTNFQIGRRSQIGRLMVLAAALVLILLAAVSSLSNHDAATVQGTAVGTLTPQFTLLFVVALIIVAIVAFGVWQSRRRR